MKDISKDELRAKWDGFSEKLCQLIGVEVERGYESVVCQCLIATGVKMGVLVFDRSAFESLLQSGIRIGLDSAGGFLKETDDEQGVEGESE